MRKHLTISMALVALVGGLMASTTLRAAEKAPSPQGSMMGGQMSPGMMGQGGMGMMGMMNMMGQMNQMMATCNQMMQAMMQHQQEKPQNPGQTPKENKG